MNRKFELLGIIEKKGQFLTSEDIAKILLSRKDYNLMPDFNKKKRANSISTQLNTLFNSGYVVKVSLPKVATFWGLATWVSDGLITEQYIPKTLDSFVGDLVIKESLERKRDLRYEYNKARE